MTDTENKHDLDVLKRFAAGDLSWRMACKELGLWDYDALLALVQKHGMKHGMPVMGNSKERTDALAGRIRHTLENAGTD